MHMKKAFILVIALLLPLWLFAQTRTISGRTTDPSGNPLPGVTVLVKGSGAGTTTNTGGHYEITASKGDVLEFRFLGYVSQDQTVTDGHLTQCHLIVQQTGTFHPGGHSHGDHPTETGHRFFLSGSQRG